MSRGSFNGPLSGSTFDHGAAALQRWHDARRKQEERAERAEAWLSTKLVGLTFHSFESLEHAAVAAFEFTIGATADDDQRDVLSRAARACWCGLSRHAKTRIARTTLGHVESVTFYRAA